MVTQRLDLSWWREGWARSRSQAQALISAGRVTMDGHVVRRAAVAVPPAAVVEAMADPYVSRGAHKLAGALDDLDLVVPARALDAGSSTGGFTQVLLERGCRQVVAVDVGTGQLVEPLRSDARVRLFEQTNARAALGTGPAAVVLGWPTLLHLAHPAARPGRCHRADGSVVLFALAFEVDGRGLGRGGWGRRCAGCLPGGGRRGGRGAGRATAPARGRRSGNRVLRLLSRTVLSAFVGLRRAHAAVASSGSWPTAAVRNGQTRSARWRAHPHRSPAVSAANRLVEGLARLHLSSPPSIAGDDPLLADVVAPLIRRS